MPPGSVAVAVIDDMPLLELSIACQVFGPAPWYELRLCGMRPAAVRSEFGFAVAADHGLDELAAADTVIVPALPYVHVESDREIPAPLIAALADYRRTFRRNSRTTGARASGATS